MEFAADQVWATAVHVDLANGGYVKLPVYEENSDVIKVTPNKVLVKNLVRQRYQPTEQELIEGRDLRAHFNSYTFLVLSGKITDFQHQALKIAQMDQFTDRSLLELAVISCLPDVARKDRSRRELTHRLHTSEQLQGTEGSGLQGELTVDSCRFNQLYGKFRVQGRIGGSFVDFWSSRSCTVGSAVRIRGKIKRHRDDKTTQLNYVKILG